MLHVYAAASYENPIKSLILAKEWSNYTAAKLLGSIVWSHTVLPTIDFDYIVPIPLHRSRYAHRGYNQAEVMADEISQLSNKPIVFCLQRVKKTAFQWSLKTTQRQENVKNAFMVDATIDIEGKTIVLVDDLMTTGATMYEAACELMKGKPKEIIAVVACRMVR